MARGKEGEPDGEAAVRRYLDGIDVAHRPLFDRVDALIREVAPVVQVGLSYQLPTYRLGPRRVHVGVWKHGISIYGWGQGGDGGFLTRHPEALYGKSTVRLRADLAAAVADEELRALFRAALGA